VSNVAASLGGLSVLAALILTGCGSGDRAGGSSGGTASTLATDTQIISTPAPPAASSPTTGNATFLNPLRASGPDPYVTRKNGVYYYTHTLGDRIGLWATTAMSRLDRASYVTIFSAPVAGPNSRDLWAPELHYLDDKWYLYYSAGDGSSAPNDPYPSQRMFVLENDQADPMNGTWIDKGQLRGPSQESWGIDGTVMEYGGKRYFIWSGRASANDADQRIFIATMTSPWSLAAGPVLLSSPDRNWERAGSLGVNEAPQVLRNPWGNVFLLYSANGCWTDNYSLGMLALRTGGDPLEPADWTKSDRPVFEKNAASKAYGPGHNSFFKSPDGTEDWLIYHANSSSGQGCGDARTPRMQSITWRADGTPDFETPASIGAPLPVPSGELLEPG
jgi:GH43 family beta-xylosidase